MTEEVTSTFAACDSKGNRFEIEHICEFILEDVPAQDASYDPFTRKNRPAKPASTRKLYGNGRYRLKGTTTEVTEGANGTWNFVDGKGQTIVLKPTK